MTFTLRQLFWWVAFVSFLLAAICALRIAYWKLTSFENLLNASRDGDVVRVESLVARGADVSARDGWHTTALMMASSEGHVVRFLSQREQDKDARNR